jgi:hypothetical protein
MLYANVPEDTVFLRNIDGFTNMLHMDGSIPSGFSVSEYRTGV